MSQSPPDRRQPSTDQPLNAKPRRNGAPALAVLGLIVGLAVVFLIITWLRYTT